MRVHHNLGNTLTIGSIACDGGGEGKQASCLAAKQAVEYPQVLTMIHE